MPSVTVYVDLKGVPHGFLSLNQGSIKDYYGWGPDANGYAGRPIAPGVVGINLIPRADNPNYAGNMDQVVWSKTLEVSDAQLDAMRAGVVSWQEGNGWYVVSGQNCTDLVRSVFQAGGVTYDGITSGPHPINLIPVGERSTYQELYWPENGPPQMRMTDIANHPEQYPGTPAYDHINGQPAVPASPPDPAGAVDWDSLMDAGETTPVSWTSSAGIETVQLREDGMVEHEILHSDGSLQQDVLDIPDAYDHARTSCAYDSAGRLDAQAIDWDNGTRSATDLDQDNSQAWSTQYIWHDAQGRMDASSVTWDDGTISTTDMDQGNSQSWNAMYIWLDPQGSMDVSSVEWDGGTISTTDWDQDNSQAWSAQYNWYDAQGRMDASSVTWDGGTISTTDMDQGNSQSWNAMYIWLDPQGRMDASTVEWDSGTSSTTDWDQYGGQAWNTQYSWCDTQGRMDASSVEWDNGTFSTTDWDQDGSQTWSTQYSWYDTASHLDSSTVMWDGGGFTVTDWDQANTAAWDTMVIDYTSSGQIETTLTEWDTGSASRTDWHSDGSTLVTWGTSEGIFDDPIATDLIDSGLWDPGTWDDAYPGTNDWSDDTTYGDSIDWDSWYYDPYIDVGDGGFSMDYSYSYSDYVFM